MRALVLRIRPANMRTVHGIKTGLAGSRNRPYSASAAECVDDEHADPYLCKLTGSGMDAPEDIPVGSVKAFIDNSDPKRPRLLGFCQRTVGRRGEMW